MLLIQVVEILWTKATRGAPRSNERVGLPRAFPIAAAPQPCTIARHQMAEWKNFAPKLIVQEERNTIPGAVDVLQITALGQSCYSLGLFGTPHEGQPRRHPVLRAVTLKAGETARLITNARHTSYSGQHYSETIFNVGCGEQLAPDLFMQAPTHLLDLKEHLF